MSTVTTTYKVTGMSCGHCEKAITQEVLGLTGVTGVQANAESGLVTVSGPAEPDDTAVATAIDEAGYELVGRA